LAASFNSKQGCDVAYWHKADIRGTATFCPLLDKNGQNPILARDGLSANDPKRTSVAHCGMDLMPVSAPIEVLV
jgi:hypothetical protein